MRPMPRQSGPLLAFGRAVRAGAGGCPQAWWQSVAVGRPSWPATGACGRYTPGELRGTTGRHMAELAQEDLGPPFLNLKT